MAANLLDFDLDGLAAFCEQLGEKRFRATQLFRWIHQRGASDFDQMTDLAKSLREKLKTTAHIAALPVVSQHMSADGTIKWLFDVGDGNAVESVFIPEDDRGTLCVSSQAGCAVGCRFCSTGHQGFSRNLSTAEILAQLWFAEHFLRKHLNTDERVISNVVMMGMGEPLLNFDAVVPAMELMLDDYAYGLSKRRVTLSTSGIVPMIDKLSEVIDVSLAVSLHAPNDELRNELVPINKKYPLAELTAACRRFLAKFQGEEGGRRKITMEYVMLAGVNDQPEHAKQLIKLLKDVPSKINLIPFNPFPHAPYGCTPRQEILSFQRTLTEAGFICTIRTTRGDDIDAACGQLVGKVQDRTRRAERWQQKTRAGEIIRTQS